MTANWLTIVGFLLLALGFGLRTIMMMRSSDTTAPEAPVLYGRELLRQYRRQFPRSVTPSLTRSMLLGGAVLLVAGIAAQYSH